jgi:TPP-dependent indolepyruvate ferredoxin oxidoreductase alpha subunit
MSRFSGIWSGMKTIQEIVESSATAVIDPERVKIVLPDFEMPAGGVHIRWPDDALSQEARLFDFKWYAALAYIRANRLNHNVLQGPNDRFGLIASGKAYNDTRQALLDLGLDDDTCRRIGIRLHKVTVVWPLEAQVHANLQQACKKFWWSKKSAKSLNTNSKKSFTTGAPMCALWCWANSTKLTRVAANGRCLIRGPVRCCVRMPT